MQTCGADRPNALGPGRHLVELASPQRPALGAREDERFGLRADKQGQVLSQNGDEGLRYADYAAAARDLDQAVHHGLTAFGYDRKTEASLLSHAVDLDHILPERYPANG
jgi:hypothetical protein